MITVAGVVAPTNQVEFWEDLGGRAYFQPNAFAKQTRGGAAVFVNAFDHEGAAISNAVVFEGADGLLIRADLPDGVAAVDWIRGSHKGASVAIAGNYEGTWQEDDDGPVFAISSATVEHVTIAASDPVFSGTRIWVVDDLSGGRRVDGLTRYFAARWEAAWKRHCAVSEMRTMVAELKARRAAENRAAQTYKLAASLSGLEAERWEAMAAIAAMPLTIPRVHGRRR